MDNNNNTQLSNRDAEKDEKTKTDDFLRRQKLKAPTRRAIIIPAQQQIIKRKGRPPGTKNVKNEKTLKKNEKNKHDVPEIEKNDEFGEVKIMSVEESEKFWESYLKDQCIKMPIKEINPIDESILFSKQQAINENYQLMFGSLIYIPEEEQNIIDVLY
ncbi:unnamed protein product [Caenorhabditis angaria]|uniref:Uncharacterized protein n=1 Tax=Caenorhabditis angaria TaxID=860376 RepID=A0A9P1N9I1_9PELO|nr:unnamed protein product [Caenorhabditis angaria]